jgi:hypothetical protein
MILAKGTRNMTNAEMLYTAFTIVFCVVSFTAIYFAYDKPYKDE